MSAKVSGKKVQRIVSLVPSATEILYFLGLGEKIVGVTENCNYPEEAQRKEKVGTFGYPQMDKILSCKPDLVLGDGTLHREISVKIEEKGIKFLDTTTKKVGDIFTLMEKLGELTERAREVEKLLAPLKERVASLEKKKGGKGVKVFFLMNQDPIITSGSQSCQYHALKLAGAGMLDLGNNVAYGKVSFQQIKDFDPEVILFCGVAKGEAPPPKCKGCLSQKPICQRTVDDIIATKEWQGLTAVREGRLYPISCTTLCRPGPRLIDGVERLHDFLANISGYL